MGGNSSSIVFGKEIGRGAYGTVHQGTYQKKLVAIKKIHRLLLEQARYQRADFDHVQQEFTKECELLASLSHPHIVQFIGVFTVKEERVLVMELLHETLRDYLGRKKEGGQVLPVREAVRISREIVAGLSYLHSFKPPLVHRDLNGKNVLLTEKGLVKISDLGQAKFRPTDMAYLTTKAPGCLPYMPPEVLGENPQYTEKMDMFSVGVLMLQIVTCLDPSTTLQGIGTIPEVERRSSHLKLVPESHPLRILIISCLNDDPQKRISSDLEAFDRGTVLCDNFKGISFGSLQEFFPTERTVLKMAVVSGDICNGRQAVIRRYVCDEFVDNSFAELGTSMHQKCLQGPENASVHLQIWSVKLWDRFFGSSIHILQRGFVSGCLLIFDLTKRSSLYWHTVDALTRWKDRLWCELADKESSLGPNKIPIPIVLVGTKYDLKDHRQVTREEMVAFVEEYDLTGCMEVSAKTAYNVDEAVNMLIYHMLMARKGPEEDQKSAQKED